MDGRTSTRGVGRAERARPPRRQAAAPRLPRTYVPRRRLWAQLDRTVPDAAMTLLVAPAGAGKTLGVAGWLQQSAGPPDPRHDAIWVQGDHTWDDAAIAARLDAAGAPAAGPGDPGPTPTLVVVDDAHQLPPAALRALDDRLSSAPETMRVLLLSRWDLPVNRLVPELLGHFSILRGDLLRMDDDESAVLITEHARTDTPEVIEEITAYAQGWCGALVLTARAVASAADPVAAARRFASSDARGADRVASEVFSVLRPRERHLLLCTANEGAISLETAAHLSQDHRAGELLADLATTGFLVTRLGDEDAEDGPHDGDMTDGPLPGDRYRIHPLLTEVVRRRLVAGGVDVSRSRATVQRAVGLDVACGDTRDAFRRLKDVHDLDAAAERLAIDGHSLLAQGQAGTVRAFVRSQPQTIEAHPGTWFFVALERWLAGDIDAAAHWMERVLDDGRRTDGDGARAAHAASVRLMRARLGLESLPRAVEHAAALVAPDAVHLVPRASLPHLLCELGAGQVWLDLLPEAEATLGAAFRIARDTNMPSYTAEAMSHLAALFYLEGRETSSHQLAVEALDLVERRGLSACDDAVQRAHLFEQLTSMSTLPLPTSPDDLSPGPGQLHASDLTSAFWSRLRDARTELVRGSVMDAERSLQTTLETSDLPEHLRVVLIIERAYLAALSDDRRTLDDLVSRLDPAARAGEVALLRGLVADLGGDPRGAADDFAAAADQVRIVQPPCRALALTAEAQLRDALGQGDLALLLLKEALTITEVRRNAVPFLGWSRHGTPLHVLLARLQEQSSEPWLAELVTATRGRAGVSAELGPWTATVRERTPASPSLVVPILTTRERDVLRELARGATYADIAAQLFVSGNTVKTHVSSLYSKLAASRRSEALAAARNLNLL